ncbi:MAG: hypothetical protein PF481_04910 [Bacteroidales bacterium]|jgi:hypothetical protein|nr:hypothetical protein [Bacteroidales bacterium]
MKKHALILVVLFFSVATAFSQRSNQKWFNTAFGMRIEGGAGSSGTVGVTYERAVSTKTHFDFFVLTNFSSGVEANLLYKFVNSIPDVPASLRWYIGFGAHAGTWGNGNFDAGPDGVLGIGYVFVPDVPLNLTIDWHPSVDVLNSGFNAAKFGFSIRYIVE